MSRLSILAFIGALGILQSSAALAYTDAQIQQMVQGRLMDRTPTDTPNWWKSLGDNAAGIIIGMYNAESNTFHRIRLLQGLGWMDSQQAVDFVEQQAQKTDLDTLRNAAIRALARGQGAKELDFVSKYLKSEDPQTRLAAAESLHAIQDPRAKAMYDSYLKEEKTPWIVDKLKGGTTGVTGALKPVASSEDRLSPDFEGTWRGYWVAPKPGAKGMQSAPVVLELKAPNEANAVQGSLTVASHGGNVARVFSLGSATGKGIDLAGNLIEKPVEKTGEKITKKPALQFTFKGSLTRMGETLLMEMRVPEKASVLVLKKD